MDIQRIRNVQLNHTIMKNTRYFVVTIAAVLPILSFAACQDADPQEPTSSGENAPAATVNDLVSGSEAPDTTTTRSRKPPIVVEPPVLDIGYVSAGSTVTGEVQIINTGDKPIRILSSTPSCQCTSVELANIVIPPGESVSLPAQFEAGYRMGLKTASIRLIFEGYDDEFITVPVKAEIVFPLRVNPDPIRYQIAATDFQDVVEYSVESLDSRVFSILAIQGEKPDFVNFDPGSDEPRNHYTLRWDFTGYDESSCFDARGIRMPPYLVIETDHPDCPILDVNIRHSCTRVEIPSPGQNWVLSERRAMIGSLKPGATAKFSVYLKWLFGNSPDDEIIEVTSPSSLLAVELVGMMYEGEKMTYEVEVTPDRDYRGLIYVPLVFHSNRNQASFLIIGRVTD